MAVRANAKADTLLAQAKAKYERGDRMTAMKLYEDVLKEGPTPSQRLAALYGCTAVHASFGDIELAQMTLRDAVREGLDYDKAVEDPANVTIVASPQVTIQLRRFAAQTVKAMASRPAPAPPRPSYSRSSSSSSGSSMPDMDAFVGSAKSEQAEVDTSIPAIIKRVALLLLVGLGLGTALFFLGLEYLFPKIE